MLNHELKDELIKVYKRIDRAMIEKDIHALNTLLDDNYELQHISGYVQNKREWLAQIQSEDMRYFAITPLTFSLQEEKNDMILTCQTNLDARIYGSRNTWPLQMRMTFYRNADIWIPVRTIATLRSSTI
ncbi:nuclear transport factor 2 family protein [Exiguobacterium sp. RIT594]|uniref:nuclear transport factor 2 family protein n=1 Tax=Exiguobacterium sp. RIT594 TaxID=2282449 RepID=UPI000DF7B24C|nr:nuclear transport factor 2 family protein [Exiguobacterium sp. RIT594]RDB31936.1 nuclear transport factor 2 family protein [Exiguobacterium sp. RIT594]